MGQTTPDADRFRTLERDVFDAFEKPGDADAIDRLYSSDFLSINADGSLSDKQGTMEIVDGGQFPVVETVRNDESKVRLFDDTAVVTDCSEWIDGDEVTAVVRHTQTWVKQDGRWQMVGWQGTPLTDESGAGPETAPK